MIPQKIYTHDWEVDARLVHFGLTRAELIEVAEKTLVERSNTVDVDVASAAGHLAYIHGSRQLRILTTSKGYLLSREKNIESSLNPKTGIKILYQTVDTACSNLRSPKAISGKKSGSAAAINRAQGSLFTPAEIPEAVSIESIKSLDSALWYYCVSFEDDTFSAELSLPASIQGDNFSGFFERIFIVQGHQIYKTPSKTTDSDYAEFEPKIIRK